MTNWRATRWSLCAKGRRRCASIRSQSALDSPVAASAGRCFKPARPTRAITAAWRSPWKCATITSRRSRSTRAAASAKSASTRTIMRTGRPHCATRSLCSPSVSAKQGTIPRPPPLDCCIAHRVRARESEKRGAESRRSSSTLSPSNFRTSRRRHGNAVAIFRTTRAARVMTGWVILVDQARDFPNAETPHKVITTDDYLARPKLFAALGRPKIVNLSRSYNYQSKGYYASLLAEARGHRVIPTVETMLDLRELKLYEQSLPELQEALTAAATKARATEDTTFDLLFCFGLAQDQRFEAFGRLLFDWYRCPAIEVTITPGKRWKIERLRARPLAKLGREETEFFRLSLHRHTQRDWRNPRGRPISRYSLAVLHDPQDALPPSSPETLKHFQRIAEKQSVAVELITRRQLAELAEFDGLFIRATTSIDNFTYRFAQRARSEGMPVIDDPQSMIRCTNKVYLHELLEAHNVPVPPTVMLADDADLAKAERLLGWPMVVKIPDGSF